MASLYVDRKGISIKADGDALAFYEKGKRFQTVPLKLVDRIVMHTDIELNSSLIAKLCSMKIGLQVISGRCSRAPKYCSAALPSIPLKESMLCALSTLFKRELMLLTIALTEDSTL